MTSNVTQCWVISDGRRGIENQALGLAEACQRLGSLQTEVKVVDSDRSFKIFPAQLQSKLKTSPEKFGLKAPFPQIAIGCGRQAIAPLIALKQQCGADIFTVYVQDPRLDPSNFDLVIAPEHDQLDEPNIVSMIGSPNRVTKNKIIEEVFRFSDQLAALPMPRIAMLIGGDSKTHKLTKDIHQRHLRAANNVIASERSLLVTTSRRTPEFAINDYKNLAAKHDNVWLYNGEGANPYFAFLGGADTILVSEDSTNMMTEACATGKPVFRLPMEGNPGKFEHLYKTLETRCLVTQYDTILTGRDYDPLLETARVAETVWLRYNSHKA